MLWAPTIGFFIGFFGSMPVAGPIAALVLDRGIQGRFRAAVAIGVGGALPEAGYAFLAYFGFKTLLAEYPWISPAAKVFSGVLLLVLGLLFVRKKEIRRESNRELRSSTFGSFALGFGVTAMNPTLIATWGGAMAMVEGFGISVQKLPLTGGGLFALAAGVGVATWFTAMTAIVRRMHNNFDPKVFLRFQQLMGAALLLLAIWFFASVFSEFAWRAT